MIRRLALCALAACVLGGWLIGKPVPAPSYTGPGDYATFSAWWGLRAYDAAAAAAEVDALDLRRASDNATCTAKIATDGTLDLTIGTPCNGNTQTVTAWIGASSALATKLYDQTAGNACGGSSCDLVQATAGGQPTLILNCNGTLPCLRSVNSDGFVNRRLASANNYTPSGNPVSMSAVGNRASGIQSHCQWVVVNNHAGLGNLLGCTSATNWYACNSGCLQRVAANAVWHALNAAMVTTPGVSAFNLDGSEISGAPGTIDTLAAPPMVLFVLAAGTLTAEWAESGFEDGSAWSSGVRTSLCHNQRLYWSTGGSC